MTLIIRNRIGFRIVVSFCALVLLLVGGGGWSLYRVAEAQFERQMADHLVSVSVLISEGLDGQVIEQVHPEYGLYGRIWSQLDKLRSRVGAARIVVFSREGNRLLDTRAKDAFGQPYTRLAFDQPEINAAWLGEPTHSVAFVNEAGATFQTGYAPLFRENAIVAVVAVDLGVGFVGAIEAFRGSVYILGMVGVLLTGVVGFALSRTLTKPIGHLVRHAQSIGEGDLEQEVVSASRDELGELARTLDLMRRQLATRDEQLRQMLGSVAHEIRNPLGGIALYAGFIADDLAAEDPRREHILKVIAEVRNLNQVISDFLVFARPPATRLERVALREVMEDALFLLAPEMETASIGVETEFQSGCEIMADPPQLKGAVVNVLKNAVQAMKSGGTIRIDLADSDGRVVATIQDTGIGIGTEELNHILDPFYTTREKGSGLGLAIVQQVVSRHQGQLEITSTPGTGTRVRMIFGRAT